MKVARLHSRTYILHHGRAEVVDCPKCQAKAGLHCVRIDGKGSRPHVERVIKWENGD